MTPPSAAGGARVEVVGVLDDSEVTAVTALVERATEADGTRPLSEHAMLHLRAGDPDARNLLVYDVPDGSPGGDRLAGYGHLDMTDEVDGPAAEVVVDPTARRQGLGRLLVTAALDETPSGALRLWSHGEHPAAAELARSMGFTVSRQLWQLRRSLLEPLAEPVLPPGVALRTFAPGSDDAGWVALNALAFRDHPEQGRWTLEDLHSRMREAWFDPAGFFVATRTSSDGERLVGFHWTKVHQHEPARDTGEDGRVGEVYVVGVDPAEQGSGLGRALTLVGLRHLRTLGLPAVLLYVDADNSAAVRLYERLGFDRYETDVMFRRGPR